MSPVAHGFFVTGTDTEIGKTFVTCALLHSLRQHGHSALGMKPVAAGVSPIGTEIINEDVALLRAAGQARENASIPLHWLNPYSLQEPIAPHIAARHEGVSFDFAQIQQHYALLSQHADYVLVEGAGGFCVPLDDQQTLADLAVALQLPVILVVGLRLGCINHALLTAEAIRQRGLTLAGWVGNRVDPTMLRPEENIQALQQRLNAPCLGIVPPLHHLPVMEAIQHAAQHLSCRQV